MADEYMEEMNPKKKKVERDWNEIMRAIFLVPERKKKIDKIT